MVAGLQGCPSWSCSASLLLADLVSGKHPEMVTALGVVRLALSLGHHTPAGSSAFCHLPFSSSARSPCCFDRNLAFPRSARWIFFFVASLLYSSLEDFQRGRAFSAVSLAFTVVSKNSPSVPFVILGCGFSSRKVPGLSLQCPLAEACQAMLHMCGSLCIRFSLPALAPGQAAHRLHVMHDQTAKSLPLNTCSWPSQSTG